MQLVKGYVYVNLVIQLINDVGCWSRSEIYSVMNTLSLCCWCSVECSSPLGLQDRSIPDSALTAGSAKPCCPATEARLNNAGGWAPSTNLDTWLQIELKYVTKITAIATQGRADLDNWVESYSVRHSFDGQYFQPYYQQVGIWPFQKFPLFLLPAEIAPA